MGTYCQLYVGDREFSWKSVVPDLIGVIFRASEYVAHRRQTEPDDSPEDGINAYTEHTFISSVGRIRDRLVTIGISEETIRGIHFYAYAFDRDGYEETLEWRCGNYLQERKGGAVREDQSRTMARRLMRHFRPLTKDQEFAKVLDAAKAEGTRQDYLNRLRAALRQARVPEQCQGFDKLRFSRNYLKEFLAQDPYVRSAEDTEFHLGSGATDLDILYDVGLTIFGSPPQVCVEFDFTEFADSDGSMTAEEAEGFLSAARNDLAQRSGLVHRAFLGVTKLSGSSVSAETRLDSSTAAREKGKKLEEMVAALFSEEFEVRRNSRQSDQELDLVILNRLADPFWTALQSPVILVECRNRKKRVEAKDVRDFEIKIQNYAGMCRVGLMVSPSGFTRECRTVANRASREMYRILLIGPHELKERQDGSLRTSRWLENLLIE